MKVSQEDAANRAAKSRGVLHVALDVTLGIDDRSLAALLVGDEV
jgi:hypothetical protein